MFNECNNITLLNTDNFFNKQMVLVIASNYTWWVWNFDIQYIYLNVFPIIIKIYLCVNLQCSVGVVITSNK